MKKYKSLLLKGFTTNKFELVQIENNDQDIPWWIEERWTIKHLNLKGRNSTLFITFLTDRGWENGTKFVYRISVGTSKMKTYSDFESELLNLEMQKGNFEEKLNVFWEAFGKVKVC
tara:strand:- start:918 stop:1265 length:348 start_codon:yes stop_codon:yes gene_type:complete